MVENYHLILFSLRYDKNLNKMTNEELKQLLDRGDYVKIARMAGYKDLTDGRRYVYKVLAGRISGRRGIAKKIIEAAHEMAARNAANGKQHEPV
jgi:hypothetical protein